MNDTSLDASKGGHLQDKTFTRPSGYLLLSFAAALLLALWAQTPRLLDVYQVEEDFRNLYWVNLFTDPQAFPEDPYLKNSVVQIDLGSWTLDYVSNSPAYGLLFQLASQFTSPIFFSKLLIFPLLLASVYFIFRIGQKIAGEGTALALSLAFTVLNLASHSAISVTGGLQRSFSMPLLLGLVYYLLQKRFAAAALFVLLSGVIYPPLFPICALTYGLSTVQRRDRFPHWSLAWRRLIPLAIAVFLVVVALSPALLDVAGNVQAGATQLAVEGEHKLLDPRYGRGGRVQLFHLFPVYGRGGLASGAMDAMHLTFMGALAVVIWLVRGRRVVALPPALKNLFYASVTGFALAWLAFLATSSFPLYLPSRHTQASFILLLLFFIVLNGREALTIAASWIRERRQWLTWVFPVLAIVGAALALFLPGNGGETTALGRSAATRLILAALSGLLILLVILYRMRRPQHGGAGGGAEKEAKQPTQLQRRNWIVLGTVLVLISPLYIEVVERDFYDPPPEERRLYEYLASLPEDVLVAGAPCVLDGVPLYAGRQVLFSCDRTGNDRQMILDALDAYYAAGTEQIVGFCRDYDVDVIVVDADLYNDDVIENKRFFFEPYSSILYPTIQERSTYALQQIPEEGRLFESGALAAVPCSQALSSQ